MKTAHFMTAVMMMFMVFTLLAGDTSVAEQDEEVIRAVVLDYIEGWYEGNSERMDRALHEELTKKGILILPQTGKTFINPAGKSLMVEMTRAGVGKMDKDKREIKIQIYGVTPYMASAKAVSSQFIDYIHLVKCDGTWRIINVLWELNKPIPPNDTGSE